MPDGGPVLVGTAKHLIGQAGGVDPPIDLADFDRALERWRVFPRTKGDRAVDAAGLAMTAGRESQHDWLLLRLADEHAPLPAEPLTPRATPARPGETVYL